MWYASVGSTIARIMAVTIVSQHAMTIFFSGFLLPCKRCCAAKFRPRFDTQRALNDAIAAQNLIRLANGIHAVISCDHSSFRALPMLVPLLAANLTLSYWVDKIAILRVYSKPKQLPDATMVMSGIKLAPQFVAIHAAIAVFVFADQTLFYGLETPFVVATGGDRPMQEWGALFAAGITSPHLLPLVVILIATCLYTICRFSSHTASGDAFRSCAARRSL